jgi:uncharacterized protein (TIGR02217 family)
MVDFHEVRLPDDIERGAVGGPGFKTSHLPLASGHAPVVRHWLQPLGGWDIGYGIQSLADLELVKAFFYCRMGSGFGFRFKDWGDHDIPQQQIGVGDAAKTAFQVFKQYSDGTFTFDRTIYKLVSGTVRAFVNSVELFDPAGFSVDLNTGIITFVIAPPASEVVEVITEFDVPVRLVKDDLNENVQTFLSGSIPKIKIDVVRGA